MRKSLIFALIVGVAAVLPAAWAADEAASATAKVTLKGLNYNLLQTLAKDQAEGAPSELAGLNALKVAEGTDEAGAALDALKGKTIHYAPTAAAAALITGADNAGKEVTVKGTLHLDANTLVVESFEAAAGDEWDELDVNSLSGQQVL